MITVKLLGGAKKSFLADKIEIQVDSITISGLLEDLQKLIPANLPKLDPDNILVVVNGVDSSALQGKETPIQNGDTVSIIPLVHGGRSKRVQFDVLGTTLELVRLGKSVKDPVEFLDLLREKYCDVVIQGVRAQCVLNAGHVRKVVAVSLSAKKADTLLSNKIETDMLMRFACTRQISDAILKAGVRPNSDSVLILVGKKPSLEKLFGEIKGSLQDEVFTKDNAELIKKEFGITKRELDSVMSKTPLEDLLVERSATLFR